MMRYCDTNLARSNPNETEQMAGSYWLSLYKTWPLTGIKLTLTGMKLTPLLVQL